MHCGGWGGATLSQSGPSDRHPRLSLHDLRHLAPGLGLLLGQRHPGRLILRQRRAGRGRRAPLGGRSLAGREPRPPRRGKLRRRRGRPGRDSGLGKGRRACARRGFLSDGDGSGREPLGRSGGGQLGRFGSDGARQRLGRVVRHRGQRRQRPPALLCCLWRSADLWLDHWRTNHRQQIAD